MPLDGRLLSESVNASQREYGINANNCHFGCKLEGWLRLARQGLVVEGDVKRGTDQGLFQQVIQKCKEPIMITDIDGNIIYVNPAWCDIYGYSSAEAIGHTPALLQSGTHDKDFYGRMWESILNPEIHSWQGQLINRTKTGRTIPVHLTITHFYDRQGRSLGFMGIAMDLSHLSRTALRGEGPGRELKTTLAALQQELAQGAAALAAAENAGPDQAQPLPDLAAPWRAQLERLDHLLQQLKHQLETPG